MKQIFTLLAVLLLALGAVAQDRYVSGKVADPVTGQPVPGATVQVKGKTTGAVSDASGNFKVLVQAGDVLTISALNYTPLEIIISTQHSLDVALEKSSRQLQEVLVTTALGIKRNRSSLPYSTQQVSAEELNRTPTTNFVNNLSGKVAGLQITSSNALGGSSNVILRGMKSLTQSNQALFVVDGVPFDNSNQSTVGYDLGNVAADINPDDIESVNVLKGAAASALYGSRASNGVIVITTKKRGYKNKGIGITVNEGLKVGSIDKSTLPTYQTEYGQGYGSAGYSSAFPDQDGFFYYTPVIGSNGQPEKVVQTDMDQVWGPAYNKNLLVYNGDAFSPGNPNYGKATPWLPSANHNPTDFFQTPITNITSVYVDGSNELSSFKAGYTNSYDKGILPNSNVKKNQLNFSATSEITDQLTVGGTFNYINENALNLNSYDFRANNTVVRDFRQWWPTNVNLHELKNDYFRTLTNAGWNWLGGYNSNTAGNISQPGYHDNPYWAQYENYNTNVRDRYFGNINAVYKVTPYLNISGRVSRDSYDQLFETRVAIGSIQTPSYTKYNTSFAETNYDLLANFDKNLNKDFNLKALLGGNVRQTTYASTVAGTSGGLVNPRLYALSNSLKTPPPATETNYNKEVDGVFAGATLTYKELASLDGTIRRDQSSTLPKGNNSYYYPAVSASFIFSRLLSDLNWLSYGKLRANYAEVGGDAPPYGTQNTYVAGSNFNGQTQFSNPTRNNNPNLVPEQNRTYEAGLEASFLHNRIGFDLTYYHSRLINQIMPISPSTATGYTTFYVNGGTVQNQGVELSVHAVPIKTQDFSWNIGLNWTKNQNKVISLYGGQPSYLVAAFQNGIQLVAETGKSYGILRGSDYQYKNGQRLIDADGYPVVPTGKSDIGNINPDWLGGITNTFTYKNLSLSFLVDIKQGGDVYSLDLDYGSWSGLYPWTAGKNDLGNPLRSPVGEGGGVLLKGVTADGKANTKHVDASDINKDGSKFPFSSVNSLAAKSYVYDASYIKLREVAFTYSLPRKVIGNNSFLKGLDVSLTGRNLWIIHKNLPYADPEQGAASTTLNSSSPIVYIPNASMGYQSGVYPSVREFALNVKLKF